MIYWQMLWVFFKLGLFTVGGGYAMLPLIQGEIESRGWITAAEFVDMIAVAEMTPGAIGVNTATFVGYRLGGVFGSLVATLGIALPSLLLVLLVSKVLDRFREHPVVEAILYGIRPVVAGLLASAVLFIAKASIAPTGEFGSLGIDWIALSLAITTGLAVTKFRVHPITALLSAAVAGLLLF